MEFKIKPKLTPQLLLGLLIVTFGLLFLLNNLGVIDFYLWESFWPGILITVGLIMMIFTPGRVGGLVITLVGLIFLLYNLHVLRVEPWDLWPLALIVAGGFLIWRTFIHHGKAGAGHDENFVTGVAFLSGFKRSCGSQDFRGGELTAFMGGCEIDLRNASIQDGEAMINIVAFMGGVEIKVPADWIVIMEGFPFMGGFEDKTQPPKSGSVKKLHIKGVAFMGGVEVEN